jgi:hypothetical protein
MKLIVKTPKPRNPFVAAGLLRTAGAHRSNAGSRRQCAARELRREIDRLRLSP